jgi:hypothetical protein
VLFGWARKGLSPEPVILDLYVDGDFLAEIKANQHRPDLSEKFGIDCAFRFNFTLPLVKENIVSVRVRSTKREVINSPYYLDCSK